jgi:chromosome segregation ATPase
MVDFRKDSRMAWRAEFADGMRRLEGRVVTVTSTLQDLSVSVTAGFVEQREYTEFAFQRLETKIDRLDARIDGLDARIDGLDTTIDGLDTRIDGLGAKVERVETRIDALDKKIDDVEARLSAKIDSAIARLERKLDQFIDVQTETNRLTDLRLKALER